MSSDLFPDCIYAGELVLHLADPAPLRRSPRA